MYVFVLRHGQSRHNVNDPENHPFHPALKDTEDSDPSLTAHGKNQADRAGRRLAGIEFDAVFSGPLHRQIDTACTAMRHQKKKPKIEILPDLTEWGHENLFGLPEQFYPMLFPDMEIVPTTDPSPTGCPRILPAAGDDDNERTSFNARGPYITNYLKSRFSGSDKILLVTSCIFGGAILGHHLLGLAETGSYNFDFTNTGISMVEIRDDGSTKLHLVNEVTHLLTPSAEDIPPYVIR